MCSKNFSQDLELKKFAKEFLEEAKTSLVGSIEQIELLASQEVGFRYINGMTFLHTETMYQVENNLAERCVRLLGHKYGHREEIVNLVWDVVSTTILKDQDGDDFLRALELELENHSRKEFSLLIPNYLLTFQDTNCDYLQIGPVEAMTSQALIAQNPPTKYELRCGQEFVYHSEGSRLAIELPPVIWKVKVSCARGNVEEDALWKVDMALSFLRLQYRADFCDFFPYIGELESHPFKPTDGEQKHLTIANSSLSLGGWSMPRHYRIDSKTISVTQSPSFIENAAAIFKGADKKLSGRIGRGLGWMTRGRRAEDRTERFLFFFTALEALLSSSNKDAPVVQNIARYAAVLLTDDPRERAHFAKEIKKLYDQRSALVHAGNKNVSQCEADKAQELVEILYSSVMQKVRLEISHDEFHNQLNESSYGTKWPNVNASIE